MDVKIHIFVFRIVIVAFMFLGCQLFGRTGEFIHTLRLRVLFDQLLGETSTKVSPELFQFVVYAVSILGLISGVRFFLEEVWVRLVPVRCHRLGCDGHPRLLSPSYVFICDVCGTRYKTGIGSEKVEV
jgi:hypothetical protein